MFTPRLCKWSKTTDHPGTTDNSRTQFLVHISVKLSHPPLTVLPYPKPPISRFYPTSHLPLRFSSSISHLPRISLPITPPKCSLSLSAYPNIPCLHLLLTDINIRDRTRYFWMFMFMVSDRNISQSVSSSSIYIGEVSISSTEYFQFVREFDGRIETMKWAKYFIVWCVFPVFILSDRIMFQMI